jgi:hypothetical protein
MDEASIFGALAAVADSPALAPPLVLALAAAFPELEAAALTPRNFDAALLARAGRLRLLRRGRAAGLMPALPPAALLGALKCREFGVAHWLLATFGRSDAILDGLYHLLPHCTFDEARNPILPMPWDMELVQFLEKEFDVASYAAKGNGVLQDGVKFSRRELWEWWLARYCEHTAFDPAVASWFLRRFGASLAHAFADPLRWCSVSPRVLRWMAEARLADLEAQEWRDELVRRLLNAVGRVLARRAEFAPPAEAARGVFPLASRTLELAAGSSFEGAYPLALEAPRDLEERLCQALSNLLVAGELGHLSPPAFDAAAARNLAAALQDPWLASPEFNIRANYATTTRIAGEMLFGGARPRWRNVSLVVLSEALHPTKTNQGRHSTKRRGFGDVRTILAPRKTLYPAGGSLALALPPAIFGRFRLRISPRRNRGDS